MINHDAKIKLSEDGSVSIFKESKTTKINGLVAGA